ncbi:MAG: hypothetical protein AAF411_01345 [Myxococcota bacterium]
MFIGVVLAFETMAAGSLVAQVDALPADGEVPRADGDALPAEERVETQPNDGATLERSHDGERPWADGVAEEDQEAALELFQRANGAYTANDYRVAVELYREALGRWDHPAIHGNLSVALVYLDRPLEAFEHVEAALAYGIGPLGETIHRQLLTNRRLLSAQISTIEVRCEVEGVEIAIDGQARFRSPMTTPLVMRAGRHRIVASKAGYLTYTDEFLASPGGPVILEVALVPLENAATYERRFPNWVPWTTVAAGAVLLATGTILQRSALGELDDYDDALTNLCTNGCVESELPSAVVAQRERGERRSRGAVWLLSMGVVTVAVGGILIGLNAPRRIEVDADGEPRARVDVSPMVSREVVGGAVQGSF